ncbi:MAG: 2OG-Fe(II) oxygenase [Proteobacteria bacterium]|nr:2OG-Fe(II) oxygenase [Pseudomonadota bacterium]
MIDDDTLARDGFCVLPRLLDAAACRDLAASWQAPERFRSHVVMQRHGYGQGDYRYFAYPLPGPVEALRQALYPALAVVANRWNAALGVAARYPDRLSDWLAHCHANGQPRPTPLLLRYGAGDYNCLHRDLYGPLVFPLQVAVLLSEPGQDFEGGEFMLVEQRPRKQSRGTVVPLGRGDAVAFAVNQRPAQGTRGVHRTAMRHGVSTIRRGERFTLGLIFHDAA